MPHHPVRNRVVAGAFLLAMLAAALAILVLVGGWESWFQKTQTVRVLFESAPNIRKGSPVLLAGHPVGRVDDIQVVEAECPPERKKGEKCYLIEVTAALPKSYHICANARVVITQALVGQYAMLNIEDVGFGDPVKDSLKGGQTSPFAGAAGELGIGKQEREDISAILATFRQTTDGVRKDLPDILEKLKATGANLLTASENAKATLKKVDDILADNRENLRTAVANSRSLTEKADKGADEVLGNLKDATKQLKAVIEENRADLRETITRARGFVEKTDKSADEIVANVKAASADLKTAVADFRVIASDTKALVATNRGNIATALQNLRETSDHLLALSKEVRRSPWRLFATPDKKEVESLNLYDSARAFASAATDLESLADTLETMVEARAKGVDVDPEILKGMLKRLEETFGKYQEAEGALLKEFERIGK